MKSKQDIIELVTRPASNQRCPCWPYHQGGADQTKSSAPASFSHHRVEENQCSCHQHHLAFRGSFRSMARSRRNRSCHLLNYSLLAFYNLCAISVLSGAHLMLFLHLYGCKSNIQGEIGGPLRTQCQLKMPIKVPRPIRIKPRKELKITISSPVKGILCDLPFRQTNTYFFYFCKNVNTHKYFSKKSVIFPQPFLT